MVSKTVYSFEDASKIMQAMETLGVAYKVEVDYGVISAIPNSTEPFKPGSQPKGLLEHRVTRYSITEVK